MMRAGLILAIAALGLGACTGEAPAAGKPAPRPSPATLAPLPGSLGEDWRAIDPENLAVIKTAHGDIIVELDPEFAPGHAERFRAMARARAYNGARFYRVIDGFVAQGGLNENADTEKWPSLANEDEREIDPAAPFAPLGNGDLFAPEVGHINGFAAGRDPATSREWLLHCPGAIATARDEDPDSGGTEFYIVLDAQRYLDRNLTVFGRVISGMQYVQKLKRGDPDVESGVIQSPDKGDEMISVTMASDIDEASRPAFEEMRTDTASFERMKAGKRVRREAFFYHTPPEVLDICDVDVPVTRVSGP